MELRVAVLREMLTARGQNAFALEQKYRQGGVPTPSPPRRRPETFEIHTPPPTARGDGTDLPIPETPPKVASVADSKDSEVEALAEKLTQAEELIKVLNDKFDEAVKKKPERIWVV